MATTENARSLPVNAITEVLLRLPVKDLIRWKCVCKDWLSLISSQFFVYSHLSRSISDPSSHFLLHDFYYGGGSSPPGPVKSVIYCLSQYTICVGLVNGLICVVGFVTDDAALPSPDDIWIWNPSTGHSKKLHLGKHTAPTRVAFAFDWDPIADDYKVVKIVTKREATLAEVWSSSSDCWREIRVDGRFYHPHVIARVTYCDVVVNGFAYWIVVDSHKQLFVASFDMRSEVLQLISIPKLLTPDDFLVESIAAKDKYFFGASWKGNFALVEWHSGSSHCDTYDLWTMDGGVGKEVWSKKLSFNVRTNARFTYCMNSINGKLVLKGTRGITLYDVETQEAQSFGDRKLCTYVSSAYDYVGSLVSIKGFTLRDDIRGMINVVWPLNE